MISILTVITARGGSKGIPRKNLVLLCGKPLLVYTIESALGAKLNGKVVVSTDDSEISSVAKANGAEVIKRPDEISLDTSSTESALLHALDVMEQRGFFPDAVLTLQPTSPFRKPETIRKFVDKFESLRGDFDSMLALHEDRTFFWVKGSNDEYKPLFADAPRRRQAREPLYPENSLLYITNTEALRKTGSIFGKKAAGFIVDPDEAVDINEPRDILFAEFLMKNKNV